MAKEKWNLDKAPEQKGKTAIVTGSNTGLGKETARGFARLGASVIMAVRTPEKGEKAKNEILNDYPHADIQVKRLDLSAQSSIKEFADEIRESHSQIDFLINNAGVMIPPYGKTNDGFELQFGTNHLGHFALTLRLLPLIKKADEGRIVNVSSGAHNWGKIDFDDLNWEKRDYKPARAYGDSKIANLYFTYKLADLLKDSSVKVTAAHPGWTATDLQRHSGLMSFLNIFFAQKPLMGALPTLRGALDPDGESGSYYGPDGYKEMKGYPVIVRSNELSYDSAIGNKLWEVSEELTGLSFA